MKKVFLLIISVLMLYPCMAQRRLKTKDLMDMNMEVFDFNAYKKNEQGDVSHHETKKDGTVIWAFNDQYNNIYIEIYKPPFFFTQTKKFNPEGKLIEKGINIKGCRIEKWLECDENGENCKVIDYEENRGKFSYTDVLKFLKKKKFIDDQVKDIEDKTSFELKYSYEQRTWEVNAWYKNALGYYTYVLDGDSGKILSEDYTSTMY